MATSEPSASKVNEMGRYVAPHELVWDAWKASCNAYKSSDFYINECKQDVLFVAFFGFHKATELDTESDFDECEITCHDQHFQSMKNGDVEDPKPALVRKVFLDRFVYLLQRSNLKNKVLQAQNEKKTVIFTGHSFGGAVAVLWTLWALEKHPEKAPLCITFGCPLVGDKTLSKAIEREKWSPYFCHIVSMHDIVPRICFSPFKSLSISRALKTLLPSWYKAMKTKAENKQPVEDGSYPLSREDSFNIAKRVIWDASQVVANETGAFNVGPGNLVGGAVKDLIRISPYRPFGYYVFCSGSGTVCCIENAKAALQMLYFTFVNSRVSEACVMEHTEYGKIIQNISKLTGRITTYSKVEKTDKSSEDAGLALQLESMGIGIQNVQAWIGLKTAADNKKEANKNMREQDVKLDEIKSCMAELEWYKTSCEGSYYDCFKIHKDEKNLNANKCRLKLGAFWDHIIELVQKEELPPDFQTREKWIKAGTEYRLLVEPLDIAHYYRLGKNDEYGHYLAHGRPKRYKFLQKWLKEEKERKGVREARIRTQLAFFTQDSCFWAYVEEARCSLQNLVIATEEVREFEERVKGMIDRFEVSADVFAKNSSLVAWWKLLREEDMWDSPLLSHLLPEIPYYHCI